MLSHKQITPIIDRNTAVYLDSFGVEYIPQDALSKITHNIFRIQSDDTIMCRFYCITFMEYMIAIPILYTIPILPL